MRAVRDALNGCLSDVKRDGQWEEEPLDRRLPTLTALRTARYAAFQARGKRKNLRMDRVTGAIAAAPPPRGSVTHMADLESLLTTKSLRTNVG
jgi:hypothetical protein